MQGNYFCVVLFLLFGIAKCVDEYVVPSSQVTGLYYFYNSTNGDRWSLNPEDGPRWKFDSYSSPCHPAWQGLTCSCVSDACNITQISLPGKNVHGMIPPEIQLLPELEVLELYSNRLNGSSLTAVCGLNALTYLDLHSSHLEESVPTCFGDINIFSRLTYLDLSNNDLRHSNLSFACGLNSLVHMDLSNDLMNATVPVCFGETGVLPELEFLDLSTNGLYGTNLSFVCGLRALTYLDMSQDGIVDVIPACIKQASMLGYMDLSANRLNNTNVSVLCQLPELNYLGLQAANIHGTIPTCIGALTLLEEIRMGTNPLVGTLPSQLGSLVKLENLEIFGTFLRGVISPTYCSMEKLHKLKLSSSFLSGELPSCLGILTTLEEILLNDNNFSGSIPSALGCLSFLNTLNLEINNLSGPIPASLTGIPALTVLALNDNYLSSSIPSFDGLMLELNVENNLLSGAIPSSIGSMVTMQYCSLSFNYLTGTIPGTFTKLVNLRFLYLQNNVLEGTGAISAIPKVYRQSVDLSYNFFNGEIPFNTTDERIRSLYVRNNQFSGSLPTDFSFVASVEILDLSFNRLTGTLPKELNMLTNVNVLLVSNNYFTGNLDSAFSEDSLVQTLQSLDVGGNGITGTFPTALITSNVLEEFFAGQNCFSGSISSEICSAISLRTLAVSGMTAGQGCLTEISTFPFNFSRATTVPGNIPPCIFQMPELGILSLAGNGIRGSLSELPDTSKLHTIDLSQNRISGSIPLSMQHYICFKELDLSYNHLGGSFEDDVAWFVNDSMSFDLRQECGLSSDAIEPIVYIKSNRLSGNIPNSFRDANEIDILDGNMFSCDPSGSELPVNDPNKDSYVCGSASANASMLGFTAMVVLCGFGLLIIFIFSSQLNSVRRRIEEAVILVLPWKRAEQLMKNENVKLLHAILRRYRYYLLLLLCLIWIVFTPLYLGLKSETDYSTHTHQYGWVISLGFLGTSLPGVTIFIIWMLLLPALVIFDIQLSRRYRNIDAFINSTAAQKISDNPDTAAWRSRYLVCVVLANVIIVVLVNAGYVYVVLTQPRGVQSVVVALTSMFKTVWTLGVMNPLLRILYSANGLLVALTVLNNLIIPVVGTILVDIECYQNLFVPPLAVQNDLIVQHYICYYPIVTEGQWVCPVEALVEPSAFTPPFIYSGQCSNSLLTNYVPIYVTMFGIVNIFLMILQFGVLCYFSGVGAGKGGSTDTVENESRLKLLRWIKANLNWLRIASAGVLSFRVLPLLDDDVLTEFQVPNCIPMYNLRQLGVNWVFGTLLLLTFGVAYPPLSIIIFADLVLLSLLRQLCIHKHMEQMEHLPDMLKQWNIGFEMEMGHLMTVLFNPKPVTSTLAAMFTSLFVFDMITGSETDTLAIKLCAVLVAWGCLISVIYYYYEARIRQHALADRLKSTLRRVSLDAVELAGAAKRPLSSRSSWIMTDNIKSDVKKEVLEWPKKTTKDTDGEEVKNPIVHDIS